MHHPNNTLFSTLSLADAPSPLDVPRSTYSEVKAPPHQRHTASRVFTRLVFKHTHSHNWITDTKFQATDPGLLINIYSM